jgi:hypothetical protein
MLVSSDDVVLGRVTAGHEETGVWVYRAPSVVDWGRCHLVCHWLHGLLELESHGAGRTSMMNPRPGADRPIAAAATASRRPPEANALARAVITTVS